MNPLGSTLKGNSTCQDPWHVLLPIHLPRSAALFLVLQIRLMYSFQWMWIKINVYHTYPNSLGEMEEKIKKYSKWSMWRFLLILAIVLLLAWKEQKIMVDMFRSINGRLEGKCAWLAQKKAPTLIGLRHFFALQPIKVTAQHIAPAKGFLTGYNTIYCAITCVRLQVK